MLDDIREKKTSLTTYILVGLAGVGMLFIGVPFFVTGQGSSVAEVNGQDISLLQFQRAVSNLQRSAPDLPLAQIESTAMRQLITQQVASEHVDKSGFYYPDSALYNTIKAEFDDEAAYQRFLQASGMDAGSYEYLLRRDMGVQNYYALLAQAQYSQPVITDTLIQNLMQNRSFSIVRLPIAHAIDEAEVSDDDIQSYYDAHHDAFMRLPEVAIDYVLFDIDQLSDPAAISDEALAEARSDAMSKTSRRDGEYLLYDQQASADEAREQLISGTALSTLTAAIDDGNENGEFGQFPLHKKGEGISPAADDALFALEKTGDVSPVIETEYGYMVVIAGQIKQDPTPDDDALREQIANANAQAAYHELTNKAFDAAQSGSDIQQIASMLGVESEHTGLFNQDHLPQAWMAEDDIIVQLFGDQQVAVGVMAQPVALDSDASIFFAIRERKDAELPELSDIRGEVETLAKRAAADEQLATAAEALMTQWVDDAPPQALMTESGGELTQYPNLLPGQVQEGLSPATMQSLFLQSERLAVLNADNGDKLIVRLDQVSTGEANEAEHAWISAQWQQQAQFMNEQGILNWLTKHAEIHIQRQPTAE